MTDQEYTIQGPGDKPLNVIIRRDKRLKKTVRWQKQRDGSVLIRVPKRYPKREFPNLLEGITAELNKQKQRAARRTDAELQKRAQYINCTYFDGRITWEAIRWVGTMKTRLGSCTNGGPTDGHIRISEEVKDWPQWVVDYLIAHELTHRLHPDHSPDFWQALTEAYPKTERARGFIKGIMFAKGQQLDEEY